MMVTKSVRNWDRSEKIVFVSALSGPIKHAVHYALTFEEEQIRKSTKQNKRQHKYSVLMKTISKFVKDVRAILLLMLFVNE